MRPAQPVMAWRDRLNRALRRVPVWPVYAGSAVYAAWVFLRGALGALGPNPVEALEHTYGDAALYLLIAGLSITPSRRILGLNLMKFRRALGLGCFFFLSIHALTWAVLDVQALAGIWADIVKRPYITVGMAGFLLLFPLAVTSNGRSVRRLGARWRKLHRLVYPAAILGALHYVMLVKGWQLKPLVMLAVVIFLLALRLPGLARQRRIEPTARQGL